MNDLPTLLDELSKILQSEADNDHRVLAFTRGPRGRDVDDRIDLALLVRPEETDAGTTPLLGAPIYAQIRKLGPKMGTLNERYVVQLGLPP